MPVVCASQPLAQEVLPVQFPLEWLTYPVPYSRHMTGLASRTGPCDGAAQMRRRAAFCLPHSLLFLPLITAWLLNYCPTDMLPTCVSLFDTLTFFLLRWAFASGAQPTGLDLGTSAIHNNIESDTHVNAV